MAWTLETTLPESTDGGSSVQTLEARLAEAQRALDRVRRELGRRLDDAEEQLRRERLLRRDLERDQRAAERAFVALAGDLRSTTQGALAWSRLLLREPLDAVGRANALGRIERILLRQLALTDALIDMAATETGTAPIDVRLVDVGHVVAETLAKLTSSDAERWSSVQVDASPDRLLVVGDPRHLARIVELLLIAARRNTLGDLASTLTREGDSVVFRTKARARAREPREDELLDVHVAARLAMLHGGSVELARRDALVCTLRLRADERDGATSHVPVGSPTRKAAALAGRRVLLVDDDRDVREIVGAVLTSYGAATASAACVQTALAMVEAGAFDLVITDLSMPGEDGLAFVRRLRERGDALPVVALSGSTDPEHAAFDACLRKPATPEALVATVVKTIAVRAAAPALSA